MSPLASQRSMKTGSSLLSSAKACGPEVVSLTGALEPVDEFDACLAARGSSRTSEPGERLVCYDRHGPEVRSRLLLGDFSVSSGCFQPRATGKNAGTVMSSIETEKRRSEKPMPHSTATIFPQPSRRSAPISSGSSHPSFQAGTYHGHAGVQAYLTQSRANWALGQQRAGAAHRRRR